MGERGRNFKEFAHSVVEAGKLIICREEQQAGNSGRVDVAIFSQKSVGQAGTLDIQ